MFNKLRNFESSGPQLEETFNCAGQISTSKVDLYNKIGYDDKE